MAKETEKKNKATTKQTLATTYVAVALAFIAIVFAARAWFSISDSGKLNGTRVDITTGKNLRFDVVPHDSFEEYTKSLSYEDIRDYVLSEKGVDISELLLNPVTTYDAETFYYENDKPAGEDVNDYIEFDLHFMSTTDMNVHLTSENGKDDVDGTLIYSENPETPYAMRIAFICDDGTSVYDPGIDGYDEGNTGSMRTFGLFQSDEMQYNDTNKLFVISEGVDVPVKVRIWVEGTDEACNNNIKSSDYSIRMRFEGTDINFERFE